MALLTKDQLLAVSDIKEKDVEVWGGTVRLRQLSALDAGELRKKREEKKLTEAQFMCEAVALAMIDENGQRLLESGEALASKSGSSILRLYLELNALDADETPFEDRLKKSQETQSDSLPTS